MEKFEREVGRTAMEIKRKITNVKNGFANQQLNTNHKVKKMRNTLTDVNSTNIN